MLLVQHNVLSPVLFNAEPLPPASPSVVVKCIQWSEYKEKKCIRVGERPVGKRRNSDYKSDQGKECLYFKGLQ